MRHKDWSHARLLIEFMETDREILLWFHQRLVHQHKESYLFDYMHRLRWIIAATPARKTSRGQKAKKTCNSAKELKRHIKNLSEFEKELIEEEP